MNIIKQLEEDLAESQKKQDQLKVQTLRLLKNALKNYQIEVGHELSPSEMLDVLKKEAKKRRDSIEAYNKGDRGDLAKEEESELKIIDAYLPEQMNESQISAIVDRVISETGAKDQTAMGQVIGMVMSETKGNANGAVVSRIVREKLGS